MNDKELTIRTDQLKEKIYTIRGKQVMLDRDIAAFYATQTRILKQAVKRNMVRFPEDFMFEISLEEQQKLVSQSVIPSIQIFGGAKPIAFTEQGVAMLSAVIRTPIAIEVSIAIIRAFTEMKKNMNNITGLFQRIDNIERKQLIADENFEKIFKALKDKSVKAKQGIFYNGQIFDAYCFLSDLIKTAKDSIIMIDNYVDENVLTILSKRKSEVKAEIYTKRLTKQFTLDLKKHNEQYHEIVVKQFTSSHDRFLIIDKEEV